MATENCWHDHFNWPAQPWETCSGNDDAYHKDGDDDDDDDDEYADDNENDEKVEHIAIAWFCMERI